GRAMAGLLAVFAEFEREILRERVRAGLAHARQNGKRLGRPRTAARKGSQVRQLIAKGLPRPRSHVGSTSDAPRYAAFCERGHSMSTKKIETPPEIYQLKVTLLGTTPPIWRRLLVPADMTLEQLHNVLQLAMGWEDCHMHDFRIGQKRFGKPDPNDRLTDL